jgi:hypothetical protein
MNSEGELRLPSPFPGMDPFIEASHRWAGFHNSLLVSCARQLNKRLPRNYVARLEERLQILSDEEEREFGVIADNVVSRSPTTKRDPMAGSASVAIIEPYILPQDVEWLDEPMETFIRIQRFPDEEVVCAIELLSPSNKSGKGRAAYLAKRFEYRHQHVNLVEIDLLLAGQRVPLLAPLPTGDYFAFVTRAPTRHQCGVFAWSVRDPLPTVPIPLGKEDGDVPLNLKEAFDETYDGGRFEMLVRYNEDPPAQLSGPDRSWAIERAKTARE